MKRCPQDSRIKQRGAVRLECASGLGERSDVVESSLVPEAAFLYLHIEPLDLLVQRAERNLEELGGLGLVPVAAFEAVGNDAALDLFHEVEERGVGAVVEERGGVSASGELRG